MDKNKRVVVFGLAGLLIAVALVGVGQQVAAPQVQPACRRRAPSIRR